MKSTRLILDLETTGLEPDKDTILEIGAIAIDEDYKEVARYHRVVFQNAYDISRMDIIPTQMHTVNGLLREVARSSHTLIEAQAEFAEFLKNHTEVGQVQAVGSTIGFDLSFVKKHLKQITPLLHYRSIDLRSVETYIQDIKKITIPKANESVHRSIPDCEHVLRRVKMLEEYIK